MKKLFSQISKEILENPKKKINDVTLAVNAQESDFFNMFLGILNIAFNLCLDKKKEMVDHYKKNYEISDEDFKAFEEMQMKYNRDTYSEGVEFMKYDKKAMKSFEVKAFLSREVKISKFLSYFIENFNKNFSFNIQVLIFIKLF